VPGTGQHLDLLATADAIAIAEPARRHLGGRAIRDQDIGPGARTQVGGAGDVIGIRVGLDHNA
jgi:hypothetical protein